MTVPEFVESMAAHGNMSKTAAVELVARITGQAVRTVWLQAGGGSKTPPPVGRLLEVYLSPQVPESAKRKLFQEAFTS
jgi:hypothetical protein